MRVTLDLYRADDGRLEGVVHVPGDTGGAFAGLLDLVRVLEGLDLSRPARRDGDGPTAGDEPHGGDR